MTGRRTYCIVILTIIVISSLGAADSRAAVEPANERFVVFSQAEFVPSDVRRPPVDTAPWIPVTLPDEWRRRSDINEAGWYRIKFSLDPAPTGLQGIYVRYRRAQRVTLYVNGKRVGGSSESNAEVAGRVGAGREATISASVPPSVLRTGENVMHARMEGTSDPMRIHGLGRVHFGDARSIRRLVIGKNESTINVKRAGIVMALTTGIITLFLWLARRSDRVMLWFSIACLSWGTIGYAYMKLRWSAPAAVNSALFFYVTYGLVVPTVILALRTVNLRWPRVELLLGLFFVIELTYPFWPGKAWPGALLVWDGTNTALLLGAIGIVLRGANRPLARTIKLQLFAFAVMALAIAYEIARYFGWVDVESTVLRHYHVPVMLLAIGATCFERHAHAVRQTAGAFVELERRIAEKTRELEANHARVEETLQERTLVEERERILTDMHDGLGASLVGLLRYVQAGSANPSSVRQRAQEALREMRIAIAAQEPRGSDLTAVVGSLREQIDALFAGSGVRLVWQVDELPTIGGLKPATIVFLQRIVFEALGNVLKHARAKEVRFSASNRRDGNVEIRIADDGCGFDPERVQPGLGLSNMGKRAERIGATLKVDSNPDAGTVITLALPFGSRIGKRGHEDADAVSPAVPLMTAAGPFSSVFVGAAIFMTIVGVTSDLSAASQPKVVELEYAEFVPSDAVRPPGPEAHWVPVTLPDQWRTRSNIQEHGWYRMKLKFERAPRGQQAIMVRHRRAYEIAFFINGELIGTARDNQSLAGNLVGKGMDSPIRHYVLPGMLQAGENVIHVRMDASAEPVLMHGLGRVYFGDARAVRGIYNAFNESGFAAKRDMYFATLAAGLIALLLWLARREDRVMLWFGITCLSWGAMGFVYLMVRWVDSELVTNWFFFYPIYGLVVPTLILSLRAVNKQWPRVEAALWLFFGFELTFPFWAEGWSFMHLVWDATNTLLLLSAVAVVASAAGRPLRWPLAVQITALSTMAAFMGYEIARYLGWVAVESPAFRHYHVPVMLLAMGGVCFDRYARAIGQAERTNARLEQRVAEKVREIEAHHVQLDRVLRERTILRERQRILADVHDGLGASLISLIRYIDSADVEMAGIERRVQETLQEMRIAIDALQPQTGELGTVLGSLRYRLDDSIRASGVGLVWYVRDLPESIQLSPSTVFALQRVLLGAIANVLNHANASTLTVTAKATNEGNVEITVQDDGVGFDVSFTAASPGLVSMRTRAEQLGGTLRIDSRPGAGTRVHLLIPINTISNAVVGFANPGEARPLSAGAGPATA